MTDWKQVAETLSFDVSPRQPYSESERALAAAIRLCELAAKLAPGEAERVLEEIAITRSKGLKDYVHHNPCTCFRCTGVDRDC